MLVVVSSRWDGPDLSELGGEKLDEHRRSVEVPSDLPTFLRDVADKYGRFVAIPPGTKGDDLPYPLNRYDLEPVHVWWLHFENDYD